MGTVVSSGTQKYGMTTFDYKYVFNGTYYLYKLKEALCDKTFFNNFAYLFQNNADYVNSVKVYPFAITYVASLDGQTAFKLGKATIGGVLAQPFVYARKTVLLNSIMITPKYNNFMDYEPYTKIELYVPYFGFLELPTNEVMGKRIYIYLGVDFDTGMGTIYIQVDGRVIMTTSNKIGIDIPLGSSNLNEVVKENVANAIKTVAGVAMFAVGGAVGKTTGALLVAKGLTTAISSGVDIMTNGIRYSRGSLTGGHDMLGSPTSIYVIITRPNAVEIDSNYNHIKGKPLGDIRVLSTLRGFTQIDQIHLHDMPNALDEEMKEIESLLRKGVEL